MENIWTGQLRFLFDEREKVIAESITLFEKALPIEQEIAHLHGPSEDLEVRRRVLLREFAVIHEAIAKNETRNNQIDTAIQIQFFTSLSFFHQLFYSSQAVSLPFNWGVYDHPFFLSSPLLIKEFQERCESFLLANMISFTEDAPAGEKCECGVGDATLTCRQVVADKCWCLNLENSANAAFSACKCMRPNSTGHVRKCLHCISGDLHKKVTNVDQLLSLPTLCALSCSRCGGIYCPFALRHGHPGEPLPVVPEPITEQMSLGDMQFTNSLGDVSSPLDVLNKIAADTTYLVAAEKKKRSHDEMENEHPLLAGELNEDTADAIRVFLAAQHAAAEKASYTHTYSSHSSSSSRTLAFSTGKREPRAPLTPLPSFPTNNVKTQRICKFCHGVGHIPKTCQDKRLVLEQLGLEDLPKDHTIEQYQHLLNSKSNLTWNVLQETNKS